MDWTNTGIGAGIGGFVMAILMALGLNKKVDKVEDRQQKTDEDVSKLTANVSKMLGNCNATHQALNNNITEMKADIKTLLMRRRDDRIGK